MLQSTGRSYASSTEFGKVVGNLRKAAGISQGELAKAAGYNNQKDLSIREAGKAGINNDEFERLVSLMTAIVDERYHEYYRRLHMTRFLEWCGSLDCNTPELKSKLAAYDLEHSGSLRTPLQKLP